MLIASASTMVPSSLLYATTNDLKRFWRSMICWCCPSSSGDWRGIPVLPSRTGLRMASVDQGLRTNRSASRTVRAFLTRVRAALKRDLSRICLSQRTRPSHAMQAIATVARAKMSPDTAVIQSVTVLALSVGIVVVTFALWLQLPRRLILGGAFDRQRHAYPT